MLRRIVLATALALGFLALTSGAWAQQPPAGRGRGAAPAAAAEAATRPPLLFKEEWKQPPYTGALNDENRRATQDAITNSRLELKLYGTDARNAGAFNLSSVELYAKPVPR